MSVHQEIPIKLTAWIDQGVVPLVEALDSFEDVLTVASWEMTSRVRMSFSVSGEPATKQRALLHGLAADLNSEEGVFLPAPSRVAAESEPLLTLSVSTGSGAACSERGELRPDEGVLSTG